MLKSKRIEIIFLLVVSCFFKQAFSNAKGEYNVGVGMADITGPAADLAMMGYANPDQKAAGIHIRLYSRAFVFQSKDDLDKLAVFVSADMGMMEQAVKFMVVNKLQGRHSSSVFNEKNVLLSGTHTHSGPGAYLQYLMYGITSGGFLDSSFYSIVDGIVESIETAYANLQASKLHINIGRVENANRNRSPSSYEANPEAEKAEYGDNVDRDMTLVRINNDDTKSTPVGTINWFAVHPTSMNNTNRLISGDNKGYASQLFESAMAALGHKNFVAAFASSNLGDVSPNTEGARCIAGNEIGKDCSWDSLCDGKTQNCIAFGPGKFGDMEESTEIIGRRQYDVASTLFQDAAADQIKGDVRFIHQYVNMSEHEFTDVETSRTLKTCAAALGFSFAGGTTDGPGMFDFTQGDTNGTPFWKQISRLLKHPSDALVECQKPKPILLPVGESKVPYDWVPEIVETQILKVGNLYIAGIPGELTTMSGRRLRKIVKKAIMKSPEYDGNEPYVVIAGLSNVYTHYITTFEEYQKQRYEAASTLYGQHTLGAYLAKYEELATAMTENTFIDPGKKPPNYIEKAKQWSLIQAVGLDTAPANMNFGDVLTQPALDVRPGETVIARFVGGHPRNSPMRKGTFLTVEINNGTNRWHTVATDADWSTKFRWIRPAAGSTESIIEISWKVPLIPIPGIYRIRHFGYSKLLKDADAEPRSYYGITRAFAVAFGASTTRPTTARSSKVANVAQSNEGLALNIKTAAQFWQALGNATMT